MNNVCSQDRHESFGSIVLPHLADGYALARWLTGNRTDALDVVQEASIRALCGIGSFGYGNARAWVLTIVRNTAFDWLRENRPAALVFVENPQDLAPLLPDRTEAATPETALLEIEAQTLLEKAIAALPAPLRDTLLLRDVRGLTYREIAQRSRLSMGTVMSRLFRGRRRLAALIKTDSLGC